MLEYKRNMFTEGNLAVKTVKVTFFGLVIFSARITSTSTQAIMQLSPQQNKNQIIGFK